MFLAFLFLDLSLFFFHTISFTFFGKQASWACCSIGRTDVDVSATNQRTNWHVFHWIRVSNFWDGILSLTLILLMHPSYQNYLWNNNKGSWKLTFTTRKWTFESEPFNFSKSHLQSIMEKASDHPTNMVMLPTGGVLLMSLTPYNDTDSRFDSLLCWSHLKFSAFVVK